MIKVNHNQLYDYELKVLKNRKCSAFLPVLIYEVDEVYNIDFALDGYAGAEIDRLSNPYKMLCLVEDVAWQIKNAYEYLIFWDRYKCTWENLYIKKNEDGNEEVRFMFMPEDDNTRKKMPMNDFFESIPFANRYTDEYVNFIKNEALNRNLSIDGLISLIKETKRNAYLAGWKPEEKGYD